MRMGNLHLVSYYIQGLDQGPAALRKQSQCNESGFCAATRPQDLQDQHWSLGDQRHYSGDLGNGSLHLFSIG